MFSWGPLLSWEILFRSIWTDFLSDWFEGRFDYLSFFGELFRDETDGSIKKFDWDFLMDLLPVLNWFAIMVDYLDEFAVL